MLMTSAQFGFNHLNLLAFNFVPEQGKGVGLLIQVAARLWVHPGTIYCLSLIPDPIIYGTFLLA